MVVINSNKDLMYHEAELCKTALSNNIDLVTEKNLMEILKIKNPNETLYNLVKMFFVMLQLTNESLNWFFFQSKIRNFPLIMSALHKTLTDDISKDIIDLGMPFSIHYAETKQAVSKINKNCVLILDLIKNVIDYNVKKNIFRSLYSSNLNV